MRKWHVKSLRNRSLLIAENKRALTNNLQNVIVWLKLRANAKNQLISAAMTQHEFKLCKM